MVDKSSKLSIFALRLYFFRFNLYPVGKKALPFKRGKNIIAMVGLKPHPSFLTGFILLPQTLIPRRKARECLPP
jgi:hypothetical protein